MRLVLGSLFIHWGLFARHNKPRENLWAVWGIYLGWNLPEIMTTATFVEVILAILLPPLGVFLRFGCQVTLALYISLHGLRKILYIYALQLNLVMHSPINIYWMIWWSFFEMIHKISPHATFRWGHLLIGLISIF